MTKLVSVFAGHVGATTRFPMHEDDLWTCIIAVMACATGIAAGFALAAFV
jgi:hypothetical protein